MKAKRKIIIKFTRFRLRKATETADIFHNGYNTNSEKGPDYNILLATDRRLRSSEMGQVQQVSAVIRMAAGYLHAGES